MSRWLRWLAALGLAAAGAGVPAGLTVAPAAASSTICVGIVVDYGEARPGGGANSFCARLAAGSNGADVLAARARALGRPQPTYRSDGLLCTIDGYPNDGSCGDPAPGGGYRYWSYWHKFVGSSSWSYSAAGATGFTVSDGLLEGWAFQNGGPERGRQPPAVSYPAVCRPVVASPSPPHRSASPAPSRSSGAATARASSSSSSRLTAPSRTTPPNRGPAGRPSATAAPAEATTPPSPTAPPATAGGGSPPASAAPSVTPLSAGRSPRSPSRVPLGTVAGFLLAAAIAAGAVVRARSGRKP